VICLMFSLDNIGRGGYEKEGINSRLLLRQFFPAIVVLGFVRFCFELGFHSGTGSCKNKMLARA